MGRIDQIGPVFALLVIAALMGGLLEAWTRIVWEKYWLVRRCRPLDVLGTLRDSAQNIDLYERGVQSSYKYSTFYANFAWAVMILAFSHFNHGAMLCSFRTLLFAIVILVLLRASHVQWTYYVNYQNKVFGPRSEDAGKRPAAGNAGEVRQGNSQG